MRLTSDEDYGACVSSWQRGPLCIALLLREILRLDNSISNYIYICVMLEINKWKFCGSPKHYRLVRDVSRTIRIQTEFC